MKKIVLTSTLIIVFGLYCHFGVASFMNSNGKYGDPRDKKMAISDLRKGIFPGRFSDREAKALAKSDLKELEKKKIKKRQPQKNSSFNGFFILKTTRGPVLYGLPIMIKNHLINYQTTPQHLGQQPTFCQNSVQPNYYHPNSSPEIEENEPKKTFDVDSLINPEILNGDGAEIFKPY